MTAVDTGQADTTVVKALRRLRMPQTQRNRELGLLLFAFLINGAAVALVQLGALGHLANEIKGFIESEAGNGRLNAHRALLKTAMDDVRRLVYGMRPPALDELGPDFRVSVVLADVVGMSYEEIAKTLGVKLGTVRSRIHRGRSQLRAALEKEAQTNAETRMLLRTR